MPGSYKIRSFEEAARDRPKKMVAVTHGSVCLGCKPGEHRIIVTRNGNLNTGKILKFKGTFADAVKKGKKLVMEMGHGAHLWTHGASENTRSYYVIEGNLIEV